MTPPESTAARDRAEDYLANQIARHDQELDGLRENLRQHDEHAQQLVAQALATMLDKLPAALEEATERAMRRVMTDKELHTQVGASVLEQATGNMHRKVGRFIFSRWFALAALVLVIANAIGWPATIKALFGLVK